jgi:subtilisin family serine protease
MDQAVRKRTQIWKRGTRWLVMLVVSLISPTVGKASPGLVVKYRNLHKVQTTFLLSKKVHRDLAFLGDRHVLLATGSSRAINRSLCRKLLKRGGVEFCEPNSDIQLLSTEPKFSEQDNLSGPLSINADRAWQVTRGSSNALVAVLDTGIDFSHPDLSHAQWRNTTEIANGSDDDGNGYVDDLNGIDALHAVGNPVDTHGHGTHVAGIIAANDRNSLGIAGIAPETKLLSVKILDSSGRGDLAAAIRGFNYVIALKERGVPVRIINTSWGTSSYSALLEDAVLRAHNANILVVSAAGNSARDNDLMPLYPGSFAIPSLITVGATDKKGRYAGFSNYGTHVAVTAPGVSIWSTLLGNGFGAQSGTSMAAPHVAAAAALLWSRNPALTSVAVRERIILTARYNESLISRVPSGRSLDAWQLVLSEQTTTPPTPQDPEVISPPPLDPGTGVTDPTPVPTPRPPDKPKKKKKKKKGKKKPGRTRDRQVESD